MGCRDILDRFYTPVSTAQKCIEIIPMDDYDIIVEPSAGAGSFSDLLPEPRIALDISPQSANIEQGDWMQFSLSATRNENNRLLVIGNPPFGERSSIAKQFIQHAVELDADTIAFILPDTFAKRTNQRCFPDDWRLVEIMPLTREECTFLLFSDAETESQDIFIPCSFFVWTKLVDYLPGVDLRDAKVPQPPQFSYLKRGDETADFSVNGNNGKTKDLHEITNSKSEHYIRVSHDYDVANIRAVFDAIEYDFKSSVNGGVAWVSRNDINKKFTEKYNELYPRP